MIQQRMKRGYGKRKTTRWQKLKDRSVCRFWKSRRKLLLWNVILPPLFRYRFLLFIYYFFFTYVHVFSFQWRYTYCQVFQNLYSPSSSPPTAQQKLELKNICSLEGGLFTLLNDINIKESGWPKLS